MLALVPLHEREFSGLVLHILPKVQLSVLDAKAWIQIHAYSGRKLVGGVTAMTSVRSALLRPSGWRSHPYPLLLLQSVVVAPAYRHLGIATGLISIIVCRARQGRQLFAALAPVAEATERILGRILHDNENHYLTHPPTIVKVDPSCTDNTSPPEFNVYDDFRLV